MSDSRIDLFNQWSDLYDAAVRSGSSDFPFDGYEQVLNRIVDMAHTTPDMMVLDIGTGKGNLASRFISTVDEVWATDFSTGMLAKAKEKLPSLHIIQADLRRGWPPELPSQFHRIVSSYVFHEFDLPTKITQLETLAAHLTENGLILIGDIAFPTAAARSLAYERWREQWDEDEYYWAADETLSVIPDGFEVEYTQVSSCGGVFKIWKST